MNDEINPRKIIKLIKADASILHFATTLFHYKTMENTLPRDNGTLQVYLRIFGSLVKHQGPLGSSSKFLQKFCASGMDVSGYTDGSVKSC